VVPRLALAGGTDSPASRHLHHLSEPGGCAPATTTVPAGTAATVTAGEPGTGGAAGFGSTGTSAGYGAFPQSFQAGTPIVLDSASPLYTYLNGQGALRLYVQGTDDVSHAAISNLLLSERQLLTGDRLPGASRSRRRQARGPPARLAGLWVRTGQGRRRGASGAPACDAPGQLVPYGARPRDHTGRKGIKAPGSS
jgi:hypothetical protein